MQSDKEVTQVFIHEAIAARSTENPFITRKSWNCVDGIWCHAGLRILPSDTPDCCLILSAYSNRRASRGWQPTASDLTADDWEPAGPIRSLTRE